MQKHVLFITDYRQISFLQEKRADLLANCRIIAVSPLAALELQSSGVEATLASSLLTAREISKIEHEAEQLSHNWHSPITAKLTVAGLNFAELIRLDLLMFFKQAMGSLAICQQVHKKYPAHTWYFFQSRQRPCLEKSAITDEHDIFEAQALWFCEQEKINSRQISFPEISRPLEKPAHPEAKDAQRISANNYCRDQAPLLVAFGHGWDLLFQVPFLKGLESRNICRILLVNMARSLASSPSRPGVDAASLTFMSIQDFADKIPHDNTENHQQAARLSFTSTDFKGKGSFLNNPYLKFQFDYIWKNYFPEAIRWRRIFQKMFDYLKPDIAMTLDPNYFLTRLYTLTANERKIKTICVPHGNMITYPAYLDYDSDLLLCSGSIMKKVIIDYLHKKEETIMTVGDPMMRITQQRFQKRQANSEKILFIPHQRFVYYTLCKIDIDGYIKSWETLLAYLEQRPDVTLVIKPHPTNDYTPWLQKLFKKSRASIRLETGQKVEKILEYSHVVLMFGRASNAGLLPPLVNIPMLYLDTCRRAADFSDFLWTEDNGILVERNLANLPKKLDRLFADKDFRAQVCTNQQKLLKNHYPQFLKPQCEKTIHEAVQKLLSS